jgi:hypothetical protein
VSQEPAKRWTLERWPVPPSPSFRVCPRNPETRNQGCGIREEERSPRFGSET